MSQQQAAGEADNPPGETPDNPAEAAVDAAAATAPETAPADAPADPAARVAELEGELAELRGQLEAQREQVLRARADLDNQRKRAERELENAHKYALEQCMKELLPVRDSLEMGLAASADQATEVAHLREGTALTLKLLSGMLEKFSVREIVPQGEKFDPAFHQAMATQPSAEVAADHVLTVYQKGYLLNDRLLRPALVIVAAAPKT
ncbi:MAG TPA: nucleotide exchange factor GrpE [Gammaproteobacteria bacterium]